MRILLSNDDGITAPGIVSLHAALAGDDNTPPLGDELVTVAPLTVQSATSHGVTFHEPLRLREHKVNDTMTGFAVDGRPADCIKLALSTLWPERYGSGQLPDLVVSGMNAGANIGVNVIYSGTVAAAIEAAFLGVPSIAVSLLLGSGKPRFDIAALRARRAIDAVLDAGLLDRHRCVNINIPLTEEPTPMTERPQGMLEQIESSNKFHNAARTLDHEPEIVFCRMNTHGLIDSYERRVSPAGEVYYWASGGGLDFQAADEQTDVAEILKGNITITPLSFDLTDVEQLARWRKHFA